MKGSSACKPPSLIKHRKLAMKNQKESFISGLNWKPRKLERSRSGSANRIRSAPNIAITPTTFEGIDLKIA